MRFLNSHDISISLTETFMKFIGLWTSKNQLERRVRLITQIYAFNMILFALWIEITDTYHSFGDLSTCLYNVCNTLAVLMPFLKMTVLLAHKQELFRLIAYTQRRFWHENYDECEKKIYMNCKRKCTVFVCFVVFTTKATVICYALSPILENIGRNESDRELPFNMWVDLPLTASPYYEITFFVQLMSLYHVGVGYFCFDNLLCVMSLHLATQFQMLQYKISRVTDLTNNEKGETNAGLFSGSSANKYYTVFKKYSLSHKSVSAISAKPDT